MDILKRSGRKMDAAWKMAISQGLKASGKVGTGIRKVVNAGGTKSVANLGTIGALKGAGAVGGAFGAAKGAVKGAAKGGSASTIKRNVVSGAKMGNFTGRVKTGFKAAKVMDKAGVKVGFNRFVVKKK